MNLRDKGYGNSMEGYAPKQERHTREKKVTPGEATVQKGQAYQPTRELPSWGSVPEYGAVAPASPSQAPLQLQYVDLLPNDKQRYDASIPDTVAPTYDNLSDEELKKRMQQLEQALNAAYSNQRNNRLARSAAKTADFEYAGIPMTPAEKYANYNWEVAENLEDAAQELGYIDTNPALYQQAFQNYANAAAAGRAVEKQSYPQNSVTFDSMMTVDPRLKQNIQANEATIDQLFWEYNNLKNEYNARLARYLQSIGG